MESSKYSWFKLTLISLLFNLILYPFVKYSNNLGVSSSVALVMYFVFASLGMIIYHVKKKTNLKIDKKTFAIVILTTLFMLITNLSMWQAVVIAPNIGYPILITQASMILITLYAAIFQKEEFNIKKILSVTLIFIGIVIVML